MVKGRRRAGRPPEEALGGQHRHPLHPFLVHIPIGAWVCSLIFDIASQYAARPAFLAEGAAWLIAIGVLSALAAAVTGFLDLAAIQPMSAAFRTASAHMIINLTLTFAFAGSFVWRISNHRLATTAGPGLLALSAVCIVALGVSGQLGGKLTYQYGVRVAVDPAESVGAGRTGRLPGRNLASGWSNEETR